MIAKRRLNRAIGSTNPRKARRHPPRPAMKPMAGAPTTYAMALPPKIHPITLALLSRGKCSPTSVSPIGPTRAKATPQIEKKINIVMKLGANAQVRAETFNNKSPINSNDLCLNRRLKTPISNAKITEAT